MNWTSYKFSKESELELLQFLKVASEQANQSSLSLELTDLWQKFLPIDKDVLTKLLTIKHSETDCIDITSSDEEIIVHDNLKKPDESLLATQSIVNKTKLNVSTTADLMDGVKELLETEDTLSEDIIKQFGRECSSEQLQNVFELFSKELSTDCIFKLWNTISSCNSNERDVVATYFSRYILCSKIVNKDTFVKDLLNAMFNKVPDIVAIDLVRVLVETTDNRQLIIIRKHLDVLSDNQKNRLLQEFLKSCSDLKEKHIDSILCLVTKQTDLNNLNSVVVMMYNLAKEFATEKTFGKLIMEILPILGTNIIKYESQMKHIIDSHKSVYESQINKIFNGFLQDLKHNNRTDPEVQMKQCELPSTSVTYNNAFNPSISTSTSNVADSEIDEVTMTIRMLLNDIVNRVTKPKAKILSVHIIRPLPKAGPRKTNGKSRLGKSRIYTSTPEKERIQELETMRKQKLERKNPKRNICITKWR
ncbi:hypothetical protein RN001_000161 [Aquatica leii]|uniref:Uncharacterized protein n=1 Tax=Aquatica leii TaxID=1421715 RepID=A0AAN7SSE2_9COLE|nr:hypothetical protein RN001_000161 [Aquatica leii]